MMNVLVVEMLKLFEFVIYFFIDDVMLGVGLMFVFEKGEMLLNQEVSVND